MRRGLRLIAAAGALLGLAAGWAGAAPAIADGKLDPTPRVAVVSAFPPELASLRVALSEPRAYVAGGAEFVTGRLEGRPVVLFLSGVSLVNAAMTAQAALDAFQVQALVFSGIAGGVDERLHIGDVSVPDQWAQPMETVFARERPGGGYDPADAPNLAGLPSFGMMHPRSLGVSRLPDAAERRVWFPADPTLLETARRVAADGGLARCAQDRCLSHTPQVVVGGNGVSTPAFVDNAAYRLYLRDAFQARVTDMESAAVAQVAYVNHTPFIAFRSLSDLAGGGAGANELPVFMSLAASNSAAVVRAFLRALH